MTLATSAIYEAADLMGTRLGAYLNDTGTDQGITIFVGTPEEAKNSDVDNTVCLFFYKIQPPGFFPEIGPNDTWRIRLHCLVTAFIKDNDIGGDELKLIGQVLAYFHENPILKNDLDADQPPLWMEVIFQPLTTEEINQLWSVVGNVSFRPSLTYEISLVPVEPKVKAQPAPPVVSGGQTLHVSASSIPAYPSPPASPASVNIDHISVDLSQPSWAPAIAFIENKNTLPSLTRHFSDLANDNEDSFAELWVTGREGDDFTLVIQTGTSGVWADRTAAQIDDASIPAQAFPQNQLNLDPAVNLDDVIPFKVANSQISAGGLGLEASEDKSAQFLIYARRNLASNKAAYSNPLILNILGAEPIGDEGV